MAQTFTSNPLSRIGMLSGDYRRAMRALKDVDIDLPATVKDSIGTAERLLDEASTLQDSDGAERGLIARVLSGESLTTADYAEAATSTVRKNVLTAAAGQAQREAVGTLRDHAEDILTAVDTVLVAPALKILQDAAKGTTEADTVSSLIRSGKPKIAGALAAAEDPAVLAALKRADAIRLAVLGEPHNEVWPWLPTGEGLNRLDVTAWLKAFREDAEPLAYVRLEARPSTALEAGIGLAFDEDDEDPDDWSVS